MKTKSLILLYFFWASLNTYPPREIVIVTENFSEIEFSKENLVAYVKEIGICYPKVVIAQAEIETGNFTSKIFKENNNLFGMKFPRQRETTAIGINRKYSMYESWQHSVDDYKLWQQKIKTNIDTRERYLNYLGNHYAENERYVLMINNIINKD